MAKHPNEEWKEFWQRLALGCMTVCGILVTGMIKRFVEEFNTLSNNVSVLTYEVREASKDSKDSKSKADSNERRIERLERLGLPKHE